MKPSQLSYGGIFVIFTIAVGLLYFDRFPRRFLPPPSASSQSVQTETNLKVLESPSPTPTPLQPDPQLQAIVDAQIASLKNVGFDPAQQSVWIESSEGTVGEYQGRTRLPAASLTKLATTLAALNSWPADYKFYTRIVSQGTIENGVLKGDLIVQGGADPFYVWESGIQLGNALNQLGIKTVSGNLVIQGIFVMNFERDPTIAGGLLRQAFNADLWSGEAEQQYQTFPAGTPKPNLTIDGEVVLATALPTGTQVLIEQPSLTLVQLLKQMNNYSNNIMAQLFADLLGGPPILQEAVVNLAKIPAAEVALTNGSGLGPENQISARGTCQILRAIGESLAPYQLGLPDVMPVTKVDPGTLAYRNLPPGVTAKTGTLWDVSTLAGVISNSDRPAVSLDQANTLCFAIFNRGSGIDFFYTSQENLVTELKNQLTKRSSSSQASAPSLPPNGTEIK